MTIERVGKIFFDDLGTLIASTRWISTHDEGIAEWLKNTRRAYQMDRANVPRCSTRRLSVTQVWCEV
jgi:hypothetical protein